MRKRINWHLMAVSLASVVAFGVSWRASSDDPFCQTFYCKWNSQRAVVRCVFVYVLLVLRFLWMFSHSLDDHKRMVFHLKKLTKFSLLSFKIENQSFTCMNANVTFQLAVVGKGYFTVRTLETLRALLFLFVSQVLRIRHHWLVKMNNFRHCRHWWQNILLLCQVIYAVGVWGKQWIRHCGQVVCK